MRKTLLALLIGTAFVTPSFASADDSAKDYTFTANVGFTSEYLYRGIAQTGGDPAVQGGFDYTNNNGFYIGTWGSNSSWISDAGPAAGNANPPSSSFELDVYGGYKGSISKELGYDVGILTYNFPGSNMPTGNANPDTIEIYGALTYQWFTAKYSVSTGSLFGTTKPDGSKTTGSGYIDLTGNFALSNGFSLVAHVGHQRVSGFSAASYSDYKVGVNKDVGFGALGVAISGSNAKDDCADPANNPYCFGAAVGGAGAYSAGKTRLLVTFSKTF